MNFKNWKVALLLSVVPMSLLTTFRLTGILKEPITISETITLEAIKWEFNRPNQTVTLDEALKVSYSNNEISTIMCLLMGQFIVRDSIFGDFVSIKPIINLTVTTPNGFVDSVYIIFRKDNQSCIGWIVTRDLEFNAENLSLIDYAGACKGSKAYISLKGIEHPKTVYFSVGASWIFRTLNSQTHQLDVSFELAYYNGVAYKKVIQPFQLKLLGD